MEERSIFLSGREMPRRWYNIMADLPWPPPPYIDPETKAPITPEKLSSIFPPALLEQEASKERWIAIPEPVLDAVHRYRPTPLVRATALERRLETPARIYFKNESVAPAGSHKVNTAIAQAYFNKMAGIRRLATETGAGQWGSALAFACCLFGLDCKVYMVKVSYQQKPYRRTLMRTWGATCVPSPSAETEAGRQVLARDPNCSGSLGIAISEAVEDAASHADTNYSLGSVLNHVLLHQTIIGLEAEKQLAKINEKPDVMIGCCGGGSNFAGLVFPFIRRRLEGEKIRFIAVEPTACPTLTRGEYRYDWGDTAKMTPLIKMLTLGHSFVPSGIHAGGLRYHGMAPLVSLLVNKGLIEARAYPQNPVFEAAVMFAQTEGILPAPETAHAIRSVVDEALRCKQEGRPECIVFCFSGHGHFDLGAYEKYMDHQLEDFEHPTEAIQKALAELPVIP